ncbi:alanine dehydrogenase [Candidatus Bathyarchaeota archaeon]|nr:alanine dehydrogenase [Candidatus Bathyarchaeota archaeon]
MDNEVLMIPDSEVRQLLAMEETIEIVEGALREKGLGRTQMPPKMYLNFDKYKGDIRVMPSYLETLDSAGVKIVNAHPGNPARFNMPTVMAVIALVDPRNGAVTSIMDGTYITGMRTGAAAAVATKYLARKNSRVLCLIGAGAQARMQLLAISKVLRLEEVRVWSLPESTINPFIAEAEKFHDLKFLHCRNCENCVNGSDVISTVTPSTEPMVMYKDVSPGTHINAIGADAPGKEELDPRILLNAKVVVDDLVQAIHSGEINVPIRKRILKEEEIYGELSEIIVGRKKGRISENEVTVFDSTGLSLLDVSTATSVYKKAKEKGVGTWMKFR